MFSGIVDFFGAIVGMFRSLLEGVITIVNSLASLFKWIPMYLGFSTTAFRYIPLFILPFAGVAVVLYVLRTILGGDN